MQIFKTTLQSMNNQTVFQRDFSDFGAFIELDSLFELLNLNDLLLERLLCKCVAIENLAPQPVHQLDCHLELR